MKIVKSFCIGLTSICACFGVMAKPITPPLSVTHKPKAMTKPVMVQLKKTEFTVRLKANATTGYRWYLLSYNHQLFTLKGSSYVVTSKLIGAPGMAEFKFKAKGTFMAALQRSVITFGLVRPWEGDVVQTKKVVVLSVA
jgi:predicted secreted protein